MRVRSVRARSVRARSVRARSVSASKVLKTGIDIGRPIFRGHSIGPVEKLEK